MIGKYRAEKREEGFGDHEESAIELGARGFAVGGFDEAGAEHVCGGEGHAQEGVLGSAFDARPHHAAFFGAVGAGAGDVDEDHFRIQAGESLGGGDGDAVGYAFVGVFRHAGGGYAEAEEAGVEIGEFFFDGGIVRQILEDDLAQFGILLSCGCAAYRRDHLHVGIEETFAEDALAHHAGCAEEQDVHGAIILFFRRCGKN